MYHRRLLICIVALITVFQPLQAKDITVYVTKTGAKYHRESCSCLTSSEVAMTLTEDLEPEVTISESSLEELALPYYESSEAVFFYSGFALKYNEQYEQAEWVAYLLTDDEVRGTVERSDRFRADRNISTGSASLND